MSVGAVTGGLFGKMPAHGDFVSRGNPVIVAWFESWLIAELIALATNEGEALDRLLAQAPVWRFALRREGVWIAGAMLPSTDLVGRLFPLIVFAESDVATVQSHADMLAAMPLDRSTTADEAMAAIAAAPAGEGGTPLEAESWRSDADDVLMMRGLPMGVDFARLFGLVNATP